MEGITTAVEYNSKYRVKVGIRKSKCRKSNHPNDFDRFYAKMSEDEKRRWAESYMTFMDYYAIYSK